MKRASVLYILLSVAVLGAVAALMGSEPDAPAQTKAPRAVASRRLPPPLADLFKRRDQLSPQEADEAMRALSLSDPRTLPALLSILSAPMATNAELQEALGAITSIGPDALPAVLRLFRRSQGPIARRAYTAFRHLIPTAAQWRTGEDNPFARPWTAAHAEQAAPFEAGLLARLDDRDGDIRHYALLILAALPPKARSSASIRPLLDALRQSDDLIRNEAAYALMTAGMAAKDAVPQLVRLLDRGGKDELADLTLAILARLGRDVPDVASTLANRLKQEQDPELRTSLCVAIAGMGAHAEPAIPIFEDALRSGDLARSRTAASCLIRLDALGLPPLLRALEAEDAPSRVLAAQAFGILGPKTPARVLPLLRTLTQDADPSVARAARAALAEIEG